MHGSRSEPPDPGTPAAAPSRHSGALEEVDHNSGVVGRKHPSTVPRRFGVGSDETVEVIVQPGRDDFWWTAGLVATVVWIPFFVAWLVRLGSAGPVGSGTLVTAGVMAVVMSILMGGISAVGAARVVATDRGVRVPRKKDGPVLIPWEDILSIEPTFPYVAEYRIELREGAPALEELAKPSWIERIWTRSGKEHRVVGSEQIWDIRSWRLEALQDALDRHAVRSFRSEIERDRAPPQLAAGEPRASPEPVSAVDDTPPDEDDP